MGFSQVNEGGAQVRVLVDEKIESSMEVFYNPIMKFNRDVSVLLLEALGEEMHIGSPLAGSGVRECRFLCELSEGIVKSIAINDYSEDACTLIRENIVRNEEQLNCDEIDVSCLDANDFLLQSMGFGYIDIDPFGTPNPFLDSAIKRIQRDGILAVTATDTSALSGTYHKACVRKYWSIPMRNHLMHEVGLRILIRKVQLIGAQFDKAMIPIYSFSRDHYMRVFFRCKKGKSHVDSVLKEHQYLHYDKKTLKVSCSKASNEKGCESAGPLFSGRLWDGKLALKMAKLNSTWEFGQPKNQKFLEVIAAESKGDVIGFYPINLIRQKLKKVPLKKEELLKKKGVWPTHLEGNAVRAKDVTLLF